MAERITRALSMHLNSNAAKSQVYGIDHFAETMPKDRATATSNHESAA
jgi:hypothetical protein